MIKYRWIQFRNSVRAWIDKALQGTHNHYLCFLPGKIGFLSSWFLKLFFSGIKINKEQTLTLKKLQKEGIVVYVAKYKSYFEYLFYYTRYKQDNLAFPEIGFDYKVLIWQPVSRILRIFLSYLDYIFSNLSLPDPYAGDYIKQELINGRSGLLYLVEKKSFYRRFVKQKTDPLQYLIEMQQSVEIGDRPIFIVPQLIFFSKNPHKFTPTITDILLGTEEKPGKIRRLVALFKNPEKVFMEISEPINLKHFLESEQIRQRGIEYQSLVLRRNLLLQINRHRQSTIGPTLKSSEELKESILTNDHLQSFMENYSKKHNMPIQRVHKKADKYLDEIAAKYNIAIIKILAGLIKWVSNTIFEGVTVDMDVLGKVKSMSKKGPLILIPCHKSHIDYLILSYFLYANNMPCPLIAAGKNLSFWPMGPIFRGGGAFFIRRTFKGAVLYSKVFVEYIYKLLEEGFNIEFFIEGGRSRTGKLILPKLGLLSILLNAYKDGACDDMIFVPIYIGYDRVMEESAYLNEIEGGQKKPESILQIIKARKLLKKRYGKIYIKFHQPMSLNVLLSQSNISIQDVTSKERNALTRNLGHRIINAINNVSVVTAYGLVASALLNCSKKRFTYEHLMSNAGIYMNYLLSQKAELADTLLLDYVYAVEQVIDAYLNRKLITQTSPKIKGRFTGAQFMVNENKRPILEYYKNNCIAFFIPAAFTALTILEKDAFQFSASDLNIEYNFLQEFFKNEFAYNVDRTSEYFIRKNIKAFIDDAVLMPHPTLPDTYNLTSAGFRELKLFSGFLKTYFESYLIVLKHLGWLSNNLPNTKDVLKKIQATGNHMYKKREIEHKEALSKINYKNALDYFITHGVKSSQDSEKIEYYTKAIQRYLNCL
ncbi:MAG: 1-acyl-sn-glycerol-3-phosphate acyltransferase [Thermodesulfobacteriota bacterium]|nr:1-acyl-sn-glycerol-3-phosphate acyltransferase [Thermodesulfobacteriota bacterium]